MTEARNLQIKAVQIDCTLMQIDCTLNQKQTLQFFKIRIPLIFTPNHLYSKPETCKCIKSLPHIIPNNSKHIITPITNYPKHQQYIEITYTQHITLSTTKLRNSFTKFRIESYSPQQSKQRQNYSSPPTYHLS